MTDLDQRYSEQLMALHHAVSQAPTTDLEQRMFTPGPALLQRFTLGDLATEGARAIAENNELSRNFVRDEFERRGLTKSAEALDANVVASHSDMLDEQQMSPAIKQIKHEGVTDNTLSFAGQTIDATEPDTRYMANPTMLSSQEQLNDLRATNADGEAINAYSKGVEITNESPSASLMTNLASNAASFAESLERSVDSAKSRSA